jgi:glutathione synthase/RimK-type ligase-like ATP-grasp enzyme
MTAISRPGSTPQGAGDVPGAMGVDGAPLRSVQARYAARAAAALGYQFRSLDGDDGYLFEVSDGARRAHFAAGASSPYVINNVSAASIARDKAFCAAVLAQAGLPAAPGRMFFVTKRWAEMRGPGREPENALAFAATAEYPLFCKPLSASNGLFAEVIDDADAFADYIERVAREHFAILAQPYIRAVEHRVFVLEGRALFSYRKAPPFVTGDGISPLAALTARRARDETGALLPRDTILAPGARATLDGPANRAVGGGALDLCDGAPPLLAACACAAAAAVGLRIAAVDIFDCSPACDLTDLIIIEVNSNPMVATLEDHGRWDLIETIWTANIEAALR